MEMCLHDASPGGTDVEANVKAIHALIMHKFPELAVKITDWQILGKILVRVPPASCSSIQTWMQACSIKLYQAIIQAISHSITL
jgi:hypothetical protein